MDTTARRRKIQKVVSDSLHDIYNHDVTFYDKPPQGNITLSEFEDLALERLQLLRIIEQASLKGHKIYSDDWKSCIKEDLSKAQLKKYIRLLSGYCSQSEQDFQARRADHLSHNILKLAYCRSEDLRRWFLSREVDWFKLRFMAQTPSGVTKFLRLNNLIYTPISAEEKNNVLGELCCSTAGLTDTGCETNDFYKVPFEDVCPLVKTRRVFLHGGFAYIPSNELVVCIQAKFRAGLSEGLNIISHKIPSLDDDRLNYLLSNIHNTYTGREYAERTDKDSIDPAELDELSKKHFPVCMRHIHDTLKAFHHLKHFARLQYGLFLKGIGLLYDDAMEFWRQEFTKAMDNDKFDKGYAYNIKHMYGKVGNMTSYSPYSCIKIIMTSVGSGEHHGCPFKHWDTSILKQKLVEYGLNTEGVHSVCEIASSGHYQIACSKYYELTQGSAPANMINHPNYYFEESRKEKTKKN